METPPLGITFVFQKYRNIKKSEPKKKIKEVKSDKFKYKGWISDWINL